MLIGFSAENFLSFKDKFHISFVGNPSTAANNELYFQENGQYLSKLMMVIGPNASGKSNVLKALSTVISFVVTVQTGL